MRIFVKKSTPLLSQQGVFVFSVEHPIFTAQGSQQWLTDEQGNALHWPVDHYFSEGLRESTFLGEVVQKQHKTLTTYLNTLLQTGFYITAIKEPQPSQEMLAEIPEMKDELRHPMMPLVYQQEKIAKAVDMLNKPISAPIKQKPAQRISLDTHHDPNKAQEMSRYMKYRFPFIGIARPDLKALTKPLLKESKNWSNAQLIQEINYYFHLPKREYQYLAIDLILTNIKTLTWENWQNHLFTLIGTPEDTFAWWDSVDALRKPLSIWLLAHHAYLTPVIEAFQTDASFWKRRIAITVQLQYKQDTETELLANSILCNQHEDEFFIQKGIGWALREYSKTNPQWVRDFFAAHTLSKLASKEGRKYL